jgi:hypothetical protein
MKTLVLTPILAMLSLVAMAFVPSSSIRIILAGQHPATTVVFNGQVYRPMGNVVDLQGLAPGVYPVRVVGPGGPMGGVVYNGQVNIPAHTRVKLNVGRLGQVTVRHLPIAPPIHRQRPLPQRPVVFMGMDPVTFTSLRNSILWQALDRDRLAIAEQGIMHHGATSAQVAELMSLLSHESRRLQLAKFAYHYVIDPHNYFQVNNMLRFNSSIRELNRYMMGFV